MSIFRRIQFYEIQDLSWCPQVIRDGVTDYLSWVINILGIYNPLSQPINECLQQAKSQQILDMCAGGGGPWKSLLPKLDKDARILLTDFFPNIKKWNKLASQFPSKVSFSEKSVNAIAPDIQLKGLRTFFTSFHHFDDTSALQILKMKRLGHKWQESCFSESDNTHLKNLLRHLK